MFGIIIDGVFYRAPHRMSDEEARQQGYKPVVLTPAPETDNDHTPVEWLEDRETDILRNWNIVPVTPPGPEDEISDSEALDIILGGAEE